MPPLTFSDAIRREYEDLFTTCSVRPERKAEVERTITSIMRGRARYAAAGDPLGIPWFFVGTIHTLECSADFRLHLHNGNPLSSRTVDVPEGRPLGTWPIPGLSADELWVRSATDALKYKALDKWHDWSVAGICWRWESYNGFGSRNHGIRSPYLWAGSYHDVDADGVVDPGEPIYDKGKYIRDRVWDEAAVSKQIGAAVILRRMVDQGLVELTSPAIAVDAPCAGVK